MQPYSRLAAAAAAAKYCRNSFSLTQIRPPIREFAAVGAGSAGNHSGDDEKPSASTGEPEETSDHYEPESGKRDRDKENEYRQPKNGANPFVNPKSPYGSSRGLESTGVNNPSEPQIQQKRNQSNSTSASSEALKDVACAGLDGTPWPEEEARRQDDVEDDKEYFKHHKASPLSEIEIADTRKPITRATDGTASAKANDVIGWLPEQMETAEQTMERAMRIWRENAVRGNPDSPHGQVLRRLKGEWF